MALSLLAAGWPCGFVGRTEDSRERAESLGLRWLGTSSQPRAWITSTDLVLLAVRDADLPDVADVLARHASFSNRAVLHLSGSLSSRVLRALADAGAAIGSLHPLVSLAAGPDGRPAPIPANTPFFAEGDPAALSVARELALAVGGTFSEINTDDKAIYHAGATIAGNLSAILHAAGGEALRHARIPSPERALLPLVRASSEAVAAHGGVAGLTGPLSRGDVDTLAENIEALRPLGASLRRAHAAVSLLGIDLLEQAGRRPERAAEMRALLHAVLRDISPEK